MKIRKNLWLATSVLALLTKQAGVIAQDNLENWAPRNVDQVIEELEFDENNQVSYTVKFGDTLGVIAQALKIESYYLAQINNIENMDLIFPGNVITAQLDSGQQATSLSVESPSGEIYEIDVPVNLSPTEVPALGSTSNNSIEETEVVSETQPALDVTTIEEVEDSQEISSPILEDQQDEVANASEETTNISVLPVVAPVSGSQETVTASENNIETIEEVVAEEVVAEEVIAEEVVAEEVIEIEGENTEQTTIEEISEVDAVVAEGEVPEYNPVVTDIPEEIHEDIYEEVVDPVEDVVVEDPAVVEEIIEVPETSTVDPMANPQNSGLQPNVAAFKEEVAAIYGVDSFSLYRPGDSGDHGSGLAVDFMVPVGSALGDEIANYSIANMYENNISYVIWKQAIYGDWSNTWESMEDRGNITANHYDHVHVSFNGY